MTDRLIPVAPREIADLVYRLARVRGVDAGLAHELGAGAALCAAHGGPVMPGIAALDPAKAPANPHTEDPVIEDAVVTAAHRHGVMVNEADFRALEAAAADFLVAESTLDAVADEAVVD